jgi:hypothetical protein
MKDLIYDMGWGKPKKKAKSSTLNTIADKHESMEKVKGRQAMVRRLLGGHRSMNGGGESPSHRRRAGDDV